MDLQRYPRTGIGYDIHRIVAGRPLVLGGVTIPFGGRGLLGHSDADCLSHAIADAILGAMGLPDIGHYFPPSDPSCAGVCSQKIIERAREECERLGYQVYQVDSVLIAEKPKIAPHLQAMRATLSETLRIPPDRLGLKATTNEGVDGVGRMEAIAAQAVAVIVPMLH